jgi:hypothetical protein
MSGAKSGFRSRSTLMDGLAAFWKLDEASGTRVCALGSGFDLTDFNTVTQAAGPSASYSLAAQFVNANDERLTRQLSNTREYGPLLLNSQSPYTVCAWIYADSWPPSGIRYIVQCAPSAGLYANATTLRLDKPSGLDATVNLASLSLSTWYFVIADYTPISADSGTVTIDVNGGAFTGTDSAGTSQFDDGLGFNFGIGGASIGDSWDGRICGAGIWSRLLTAKEKLSLYAEGVGLAFPFA